MWKAFDSQSCDISPFLPYWPKWVITPLLISVVIKFPHFCPTKPKSESQEPLTQLDTNISELQWLHDKMYYLRSSEHQHHAEVVPERICQVLVSLPWGHTSVEAHLLTAGDWQWSSCQRYICSTFLYPAVTSNSTLHSWKWNTYTNIWEYSLHFISCIS